jgi:hypothetical protein
MPDRTPVAAGPTDAALARSVRASDTPRCVPEPTIDEPLRLELRDSAERDAAWELDVEGAGVTPSADWDPEDDAGSYAGPV